MPNVLTGKCVVLGISGGIAAYKAADLVSRLVKMGACVRVVMTENACRFVAPITFETLSGSKTYVDQFDRAYEIEHISLAKQADVLLIAPATGNIIAKIANGIADDLLSSVALAMPAPIMIAPAMNSQMYRAQATQDNIATLKKRGVHFVGPKSGRLACGDEDIGRMSEPEEIAEAVVELLNKKRDLSGKHVMVTAGPTREPLDPVRYLTNHSSGKMGYAIAEAAVKRGAAVTLISGPVSIAAPQGVELISVTTTGALYSEVLARAADCDAVIQAAAPADYSPIEYSEKKLKKTGEALTVTFAHTPDVAKALGEQKKKGQVLVAFAAETDNLIENAKAKRLKKNADLIIANDVTQPGAGFSVDTNRVTIIGEGFEDELPLMSKSDVADAILDRVVELL